MPALGDTKASGRLFGVGASMRCSKCGSENPAGKKFCSECGARLLIQGRELMFVGKVRAGFTPALRPSVFKEFHGLETERCQFRNLPESRRSQWGEGVTAAEMEKCRWLKPRLAASIEYLEWTGANDLRHSKFAGLTKNSAFRAS
jgi:ATP-dependent DNA ligase